MLQFTLPRFQLEHPLSLAFELGFTGIGIDKSFVHLDVSRERCAIWGY